MPASHKKWTGRVRIACIIAVAAAAFAVAAESTCRVDDYVRIGIPILASPDRQRDLEFRDGQIKRGRPGGRYEKWRLNSFGFRGPEIQQLPPKGTIRVMVLGASESFGLYEAEGNEFPRQLEEVLDVHGDYEVVNAAMAGMTIGSMNEYWRHWAAKFRPHFVVVYPSPLFYLGDKPKSKQSTVTSTDARGTDQLEIRSRLVHRAKQAWAYPDFVQAWRDRREIDELTRSKPTSWFFSGVPQTNVDWFIEDLRQLSELISQTGATPIVVTHALRCKSPPTEQDWEALDRFRVYVPRASPQVIVQFEDAVRHRMLMEFAHGPGSIVDGAEVLNGRLNCFADLVHFTDEGAIELAKAIAPTILMRSGVKASDAVQ